MKRQPSLKEAQDKMQMIDILISQAAEAVEGKRRDWIGGEEAWRDGVSIRQKWGRNFWFYPYPLSCCQDKCADCGRSIVDRRDGQGKCQPTDIMEEKEGWEVSYSDYCLSCFNRRRPHYTAVNNWKNTKRVISRTERLIYVQRQNVRSASRVSTERHAGSGSGKA